ncbi:hypothetical protein JCM10213_003689 [Rhodosporidiobolus nylandii]
MSGEASTSRLGLCGTCATASARYRCPACSFPSCSLPCSTAHKTASSCSGIAAPVWAQPVKANEMTWGSLMRDSSFISGVGRAVEEVGRQLVQDKVIPQGRGAGRGVDEAEAVRLDERSDKEDRMVREARNEGVELMLLPKGMSKRNRNGTRWDPKNNRLEWTVEIAFQPRPSADSSSSSPTSITTVPQPSSSPLYDVLTAALGARDRKGKGKEVSPEDAAWVLTEKAWVETLKPVKVASPPSEEEEGKIVGEETAFEEGSSAEQVKPAEEGAEVEGAALPAEAEASAPVAAEQELPAEAPEASTPALPPPASSDDSPFVLLLTFFTRPAPSFAPSDTPLPTTRLPGRQVYLVDSAPATTLREALEGATLLEHPTFELWPRETFLRQKLLGKLKVVERPSAESVRSAAAAAYSGAGGRGRGRGRGRGDGRVGRGGERGGYGGRDGGPGYEGGEGSGGGVFEGRAQDSGWGKRGPPSAAAGEGEGGAEKKPRLEVQIEALLGEEGP